MADYIQQTCSTDDIAGVTCVETDQRDGGEARAKVVRDYFTAPTHTHSFQLSDGVTETLAQKMHDLIAQTSGLVSAWGRLLDGEQTLKNAWGQTFGLAQVCAYQSVGREMNSRLGNGLPLIDAERDALRALSTKANAVLGALGNSGAYPKARQEGIVATPDGFALDSNIRGEIVHYVRAIYFTLFDANVIGLYKAWAQPISDSATTAGALLTSISEARAIHSIFADAIEAVGNVRPRIDDFPDARTFSDAIEDIISKVATTHDSVTTGSVIDEAVHVWAKLGELDTSKRDALAKAAAAAGFVGGWIGKDGLWVTALILYARRQVPKVIGDISEARAFGPRMLPWLAKSLGMDEAEFKKQWEGVAERSKASVAAKVDAYSKGLKTSSSVTAAEEKLLDEQKEFTKLLKEGGEARFDTRGANGVLVILSVLQIADSVTSLNEAVHKADWKAYDIIKPIADIAMGGASVAKAIPVIIELQTMGIKGTAIIAFRAGAMDGLAGVAGIVGGIAQICAGTAKGGSSYDVAAGATSVAGGIVTSVGAIGYIFDVAVIAEFGAVIPVAGAAFIVLYGAISLAKEFAKPEVYASRVFVQETCKALKNAKWKYGKEADRKALSDALGITALLEDLATYAETFGFFQKVQTPPGVDREKMLELFASYMGVEVAERMVS